MTPTQNDQNIEGTPSLDLEAIKARAAAATEGPWEWDDSTIGQHWSRPQPWATVVDDEVKCGDYCYGGSSSPIKSDADGQFLAHAREDIPALVAEVERLCEERDEYLRRLDAVEAKHTLVTVRYGDAPDELACRACGTHYEYPVAWPCQTVKAARGEA